MITACSMGSSSRQSAGRWAPRQRQMSFLFVVVCVVVLFLTTFTAQATAQLIADPPCEDIPCTSLQLISDLKDMTKLSTCCKQGQYFDPEICCNSQDEAFAKTIPTCTQPNNPCLDLSFEDNYSKCCDAITATTEPWVVKRCCAYRGVVEGNKGVCCGVDYFPELCLADQKKCCSTTDFNLDECCAADSDLFNYLEQFEPTTALKCCNVKDIPESLQPKCCENKWDESACCALPIYANNRDKCPCDYVKNSVACCAEKFDKTRCCSVVGYEDDRRCPDETPCDYTKTPGLCCSKDYQKERCCSKQPNGYYDEHHCCLEDMTGPYYDQATCSPKPPTCDIVKEPSKCCTQPNLFDPEYCCSSAPNGYYDVQKCCKLDTPYFIEAKCPNECTNQPCPADCDYTKDPIKCCRELFIHDRCCYLGPADDIINPTKYYDDTKCCAAYEHDFRRDKCCVKPEYETNPVKCPCLYEETPLKCCTEKFDSKLCCDIAPWKNVDKRCPLPPCTGSVEECCEQQYDKTKCCSKQPNGYYDIHHCCLEDETSQYYDEKKCEPITPEEPCDFKKDRSGCCQKPNLFDPVLCCDTTTNYYDQRCCELGRPFFNEVKCPTECLPSGTEPCVPSCDYKKDRDACCKSTFIHSECCAIEGHNDIPNDYYYMDKCCKSFPHDFRQDKCCSLTEFKDDRDFCPCDYNSQATTCCQEVFNIDICCKLSEFSTDNRCPEDVCDYDDITTKKTCCLRDYKKDKCCDVKTFYDKHRCCLEDMTSIYYDKATCSTTPPKCDYKNNRAECCANELTFDIELCCETTPNGYYLKDKCCLMERPYVIPSVCCTDPTKPCVSPCDYDKTPEKCCVQKNGFRHDKCCHLPGHDNIPNDYYLAEKCCAASAHDFRVDKCCSLPDYIKDRDRCPCDYTNNKKSCCEEKFDSKLCCDIAPWQNVDKRCPLKPCDYNSTPERCCSLQYDKNKCCSLQPNAFYDAHRCCQEEDVKFINKEVCDEEQPEPCDFKTDRAGCCAKPNLFDPVLCCDASTTPNAYYDVNKCCLLDAPFYVEAKCPGVCPPSGTTPCVEDCDYDDESQRLTCCQKQFIHSQCCHVSHYDNIKNDFYMVEKCCESFPHDFRIDKCCELTKFEEDERCPCDYTKTPSKCCGEKFDKNLCCNVIGYEEDRRCPDTPCDYTKTPDLCCSKDYQKERCCSKQPNGYYDDHHCCLEDMTSIYYDQVTCSPNPPTPCDIAKDPATCCQKPNLFDPEFCCSSAVNGYYDVQKCCQLDTPYFIESKCPNECTTNQPCPPKCNYALTPERCCDELFIHDRCCYLGSEDDLINPKKYYDESKCCAAYPHDFKKDTCCVKPEYDNDDRCPCNYEKSAQKCCSEVFNVDLCCSKFPTDLRCPFVCDYTKNAQECCEKKYDSTRCCVKTPGAYYDEQCCSELTTSPYFDQTKCPTTSCWSQPNASPSVCCAKEWLSTKCCDTTTPNGYYDEIQCCKLNAPFYNEEKCEKCPDGTPVPCIQPPKCDYNVNRAACCASDFDHEQCCHSTWHPLPNQYYLASKCCNIPTDFNGEICCELPGFEGVDPRCSTYTDCTDVTDPAELKKCCDFSTTITKNCCVFEEYYDNEVCYCDYENNIDECCAGDGFRSDPCCEIAPYKNNPGSCPCVYENEPEKCCKRTFVAQSCCDIAPYKDNREQCPCDYVKNPVACCKEQFDSTKCCSTEPWKSQDVRCPPEPCNYITNTAECCALDYQKENCCDVTEFYDIHRCCLEDMSSEFYDQETCSPNPPQCDIRRDPVKCCAQPNLFDPEYCCSAESTGYYDKTRCCKLDAPYFIEKKCDPCIENPLDDVCRPDCDYIATPEKCCSELFIHTKCCYLGSEDDLVNPKKYYSPQCCAAYEHDFRVDKCCSLPAYEDTDKCPCNYEKNPVSCCAKKFDVTKCCKPINAPWNLDKRCPLEPCNYQTTPSQCCAQQYDKTKCCSKQPNGYYDAHHCCEEDMTGPYYDQDTCEPITPEEPCDFKKDRSGCCKKANLFDPVLCCDTTTNYYDERCCKLGQPFYNEVKCPNECKPTNPTPCLPDCDYKNNRDACCKKQFIHNQCCHLDGHDDIQNDYYLIDKCCYAFPHDFRVDKCCSLTDFKDKEEYCPCDYNKTPEVCCNKKFDETKCCSLTTFYSVASCCSLEDKYQPTKCCDPTSTTYQQRCCESADTYNKDKCACDDTPCEGCVNSLQVDDKQVKITPHKKQDAAIQGATKISDLIKASVGTADDDEETIQVTIPKDKVVLLMEDKAKQQQQQQQLVDDDVTAAKSASSNTIISIMVATIVLAVSLIALAARAQY